MATTEATKTRVCIIGAGPSGLLTLRRFLQLGDQVPEVVCYEKQSTWGGQWNFTEKIGTDEHGEPIHSAIYKNLWFNTPKECIHLPEYTFDEHFGRPTPSYLSLPVMRSYLQGLMKKSVVGVEDHIQYSTAVRDVQYDKQSDQFRATITHIPTGKSENQTFSHVIVASGIYSTPNFPDIEGLANFPGLVMHSHNVKRPEMFRKRRVLLIGSMYSGEDIAAHCVKYGAEFAIIAYRTSPREFDWPAGIEERPMVTGFTNDVATFKDGTTATVDTVILCTGYNYNFPFLEGSLRLGLEKQRTSLYPDHLYKGLVWLKGGNHKLLYAGCQVPIHSLPVYDVQSVWMVQYITGINPLTGHRSDRPISILKESAAEIKRELEARQAKLAKVTCEFDAILFMAEYIQGLADEVGYQIDFDQYDSQLRINLTRKSEDIMTYRDDQYTCVWTNVVSPKPKTPWLSRFDDGMDEFLK